MKNFALLGAAGYIAPRHLKAIKDTDIEFSDGFTELHTESYKNILDGNGFGLADARPSVEIAHSIRNSKIVPNSNLKHKFLH